MSAFSLVEIALALGVISFAFVALMGLLASGVNVFRDAMNTTVTSGIAQRLAAEVQEADFYALLRKADHLDTGADLLGRLPRRYFDDQGTEVLVADPELPTAAERARIFYEANVRISCESQLQTRGDAAGAGRRARSLATVIIQIVSNPQGRDLATDDTDKLFHPDVLKVACESYTALVARNGSMESLSKL